MNRLVTLSFLAVISFACAAPRSIQLPVSMEVPPATSKIEVSGSKSRTRVFDFEIPRVQAKTRGFALNLGPITVRDRSTQQRSFVIQRAGTPFLAVDCTGVNQQKREGLVVYYQHTYACAADGFSLQVNQTGESYFSGNVKLGDVDLELVSTIEMSDGKKGWSPSGFHLRRNGKWVATFEYFREGKAYLANDLTPEEQNAALAAVVSISSTGRWFQLNPDGTSGKHVGL